MNLSESKAAKREILTEMCLIRLAPDVDWWSAVVSSHSPFPCTETHQKTKALLHQSVYTERKTEQHADERSVKCVHAKNESSRLVSISPLKT